MDWQTWVTQTDPANLLVGLIAAVGLGFTVVSIRRQTHNSRLEKTADVMMDCTRRFADLFAFRHQLDADIAIKTIVPQQAAHSYYNAYWNLQWDQYNYFLIGLLPREILTVWFMDRLALLERGEEMFGVSFKDGWKTIGRQQMLNYAAFSALVDAIWELQGIDKKDAKLKVDALLKRHFKIHSAMRTSYK